MLSITKTVELNTKDTHDVSRLCGLESTSLAEKQVEIAPEDWVNVPPECRNNCELGHDDRKKVRQRGRYYFTVSICQKCGRVVVRDNLARERRLQAKSSGFRWKYGIKEIVWDYLHDHGPATLREIEQETGVRICSAQWAISRHPEAFYCHGTKLLPSHKTAKLWASR